MKILACVIAALLICLSFYLTLIPGLQVWVILFACVFAVYAWLSAGEAFRILGVMACAALVFYGQLRFQWAPDASQVIYGFLWALLILMMAAQIFWVRRSRLQGLKRAIPILLCFLGDLPLLAIHSLQSTGIGFVCSRGPYHREAMVIEGRERIIYITSQNCIPDPILSLNVKDPFWPVVRRVDSAEGTLDMWRQIWTPEEIVRLTGQKP